ncbi:MAG: glutamate mutase L [Nostocoides sp.]
MTAGPYLVVDVGSTFTKAALVSGGGDLLGTAAHRTTIETDVMNGYAAVAGSLAAHGDPAEILMCSSAGGGLRLAVVGYEREVTAQAGRRVGLTSGAKVVHVAVGPLGAVGVDALRESRPDIVLLVGGTDGGNQEVLRHNATRLARARIRPPIVLAGNAEAAGDVAAILAATGRRFVVTDNVLPRIGVINPEPARSAIRATFLQHVIGGKGLSRGPAFARLVRAATPDAVLTGVEVMADVVGGDVMVVDIGGATTDVYSVLTPQGEDATLAKDVVGPLWHARTVEGDLGMRWNAEGIVSAASSERILLSQNAIEYAAHVASDVGHLPGGPAEWAAERDLSAAAAVVAARRHARSQSPSEGPRPLRDVQLLVGSGGVLRHAPDGTAGFVLDAIRADHAGGWRTPQDARTAVDAAYVLCAVGLLAPDHPLAARRLAATVIPGGP